MIHIARFKSFERFGLLVLSERDWLERLDLLALLKQNWLERFGSQVLNKGWIGKRLVELDSDSIDWEHRKGAGSM